MKVKSAIKKIETRLQGEDYQLEIDINHRGSSLGHICLTYKGKIMTLDINVPWDDEDCQDLYRNSRKATEKDFYKYGKVGGAIHHRRLDDHHDLQTDYFAGGFYSNVTQMLDSLKVPPSKYSVGDMVAFKDNKRMGRRGLAKKIGVITKDRGKFYNIMVCESNVLQTYISERDIGVAVPGSKPALSQKSNRKIKVVD